MTELVTDPNFDNPDAFVATLLEGHDGLSEEETHALNARLVLILANHIGDIGVVAEAISTARMR